jgi:molecular chaperone GrpE
MSEKEKKNKQENQNENQVQNETDKVKELENLIEEKNKEIEELNNKYLRLLAETENMKKRLEKEKKDFLEYANENLLKDLLPVIDNMERAVTHADEEANIDDFIKGVELILTNFKKILEKYDVKEVDALHKPFDPNYHEAMTLMENNEHPSNTVVEEMQKGYTFKNRLLRPSLVAVSKNTEKKDNDVDN